MNGFHFFRCTFAATFRRSTLKVEYSFIYPASKEILPTF